MSLPDGAEVEVLERLFARRHVGESAQPDEPVGVVQISELADQADADRFLRLHERALEQIDQGVAAARLQRVLA